MILINLLPPEYRKERGSKSSFLRNKRALNGIGAGFLILTFIFYVQYQLESVQFHKLRTQWATLEKEVQRVTQLKAKIEQGVKGENDFLESYIATSFPTTVILSTVNVLLPPSIWLLELKVTRRTHENTLLLKGLSFPGRQGVSIQDIEKYLSGLKEKFPTRVDLILTTSRQLKENKELTLFTAVFKWT